MAVAGVLLSVWAYSLLPTHQAKRCDLLQECSFLFARHEDESVTIDQKCLTLHKGSAGRRSTTMTSANACPQCGSARLANAPAGLCPHCLLGHGLRAGSVEGLVAQRLSGVLSTLDFSLGPVPRVLPSASPASVTAVIIPRRNRQD